MDGLLACSNPPSFPWQRFVKESDERFPVWQRLGNGRLNQPAHLRTSETV